MKLLPHHFGGMKNIFTRGSNGLAAILNGKIDRSKVAPIQTINTADATDLASAIALTNANKAKVNALIAALNDNT